MLEQHFTEYRNLYHLIVKTTLNLDDDLLARAKAHAALERKSLTRLIEEGLSLRLRAAAGAAPRAGRRTPQLPVFDRGTGLRPGIDPCSNRALWDAADADA
ncbi:MAG: DUF2191 domain-containing protein [Rubrivivax sp.]|nr:DUF2191 domain-containing protein [Rubrivivax sp.]